MITVKRLKELLKDIPDNAKCYAYDGELTGIQIVDKKYNLWWITATEKEKDDKYTEGFQKKENKI